MVSHPRSLRQARRRSRSLIRRQRIGSKTLASIAISQAIRQRNVLTGPRGPEWIFRRPSKGK
jgi:hypothetical protein